MPYTTTGIFGKSSNVGTLMLAQRIGPERYAEMLQQVRSRPAHRRRAAGRERGPGAADRPVVGQHVRQPAYRPRPFDDPAADDRHVPGDRQRRRAHPAAHRQDHHRPRRHPHRRAPAGGRAGGVAADRADRAADAARDGAARSDGRTSRAPARRPPSTATRLPARPAPRSRSTPAAAATTTTSTGSRSRAWRPPTIPRYVVGIMADNPQRTADGQRGTTMAPLFHNIAAWLLQRENVPLSPDPGPPLTLQAA